MLNFKIIPVSAFMQNCAVIWDENKNCAILDAGGNSEIIKNFVEANQLKVEKLLITHAHLDHILAIEELKDYFQVPVIGSHKADTPIFDALPEMCEMFGLPKAKAFLPDIWLDEGESIQVGQLNFEIYHLPGHSPGHIGYINHNNKIAFTGDVLFKDSIGRTDLLLGDYETLIQSIKNKLLKLGDEYHIMPGHGARTTIGIERLNNPFLR